MSTRTLSHRSRRIVAVLMLVAALAIPCGAARAQQPGEPIPGVLPGDAVVHVQTAGIDHALNQVEALALAVVRGTPYEGQIAPGMLHVMLQGGTGLPMDLLNRAESLHFILCNPPMPGQEPPLAVLLPLREGATFDTFLAALRQMEARVEEIQDGIHEATMPQFGTVVIVDAGDGRIALSPNAMGALHVATLAKAWDFQPGWDQAGAPVGIITIDTGRLTTFYKPMIDMGVTMASMSLSQAAMNNPEIPPAVQQMLPLIPPYIQDAAALLQTVKSMRMYVYADETGASVSTFLTPKEGTTLRRIAETASGLNADYHLAPMLPADMPAVAGMNYAPEFLEEYYAFLERVMTDFGDILGADSAETLLALSREMMDLIDGQIVMGFRPILSDGMGAMAGGASVTAAMRIRNAEQYLELFEENVDAMNPLMSGVFELIAAVSGEPIPFSLQYRYTPEAGTAAGVAYALLSMEVVEEGEMPEDPVQQQQIASLQQSFANVTQAIAVVDGLLVMTQGPDAEARLAGEIEAFRSGTARLGATPDFQAAFDAAEPRQLGFMLFRVADYMKAVFAQMSRMPGQPPMFAEIVDAIPPSEQPVTVAFGAEAGSFKILESVPASAIREVISIVTTMEGTMQGGMMMPEEGMLEPAPQGAEEF